MSRSLSLTFRQAMMAEQTGEIPVCLLTVTHPKFPGTLRLSTDPTQRLSDTPLQYGTISRGNTFLFCPMTLILPNDVGEQAPTSKWAMENVDRTLVALMRSISTPGDVILEVVRASTPDVVEFDYPAFQFRNSQGNADLITMELSIDGLTLEEYPAGSFAPSSFPGLF